MIPPQWAPYARRCQLAAASLPRLRGLDLFAGAGRFAMMMASIGLSCAAFDIQHSDSEDVLSEAGTIAVMTMMFQCVRGALILMGPPCKNWIALSRRTHRRTLFNIYGDVLRNDNRIGNAIADFTSNVMIFADYLGLVYFTEQPSDSVFWHWPSIKVALEITCAVKVTWHMFVFGAKTPKPQTGYCTAPWASRFQRLTKDLYRSTPRPKRRLVKPSSKAGSYTGLKPFLEKSAEYPEEFVRTLIQFHFMVSVASASSDDALREESDGESNCASHLSFVSDCPLPEDIVAAPLG